nr:hypothetical protein [Azospirillum sp. INR13]
MKPVKPGKCTLYPEEERAHWALPIAQRFRILHELHNLRIVRQGEEGLSPADFGPLL